MGRTGPNCSDSPLAGLAGAAARRYPGIAASVVQLAVVAAVDTFLDVAVAVHNLWPEDKRPSPVAAAEIAGGPGSQPLLEKMAQPPGPSVVAVAAAARNLAQVVDAPAAGNPALLVQIDMPLAVAWPQDELSTAHIAVQVDYLVGKTPSRSRRALAVAAAVDTAAAAAELVVPLLPA